MIRFQEDDGSKVWINVDIPTRTCTVHQSSCSYTRMAETPYKGIGKDLRDGGWHSFQSAEQAEACQRTKYSDYKYKTCGRCF
ncbi:MAG TPA: hypothetical protein VIG80_15815 [Bacillaceae bacterium]